MSEEKQEFAGTAELVQIMRMVLQARQAFPDNPEIAKLHKAVTPMMTPDLCAALLIQNATMQQELDSKRKSPLAQMMANQ